MKELVEAMDAARVALNWLTKVIDRTYPENGTVLAGKLRRIKIESFRTADRINRMLFCLKGDENGKSKV